MGIQSFANQDSGACIIKFSTDGNILDFIAISEERLIRKKYPYSFPVHSIEYCMDYFGISDLSKINLLVTDNIRINRLFISGPAYNITEIDYLKQKLSIDPKKIITISHHMAHAASTYYTSEFDDAAILIIDGNGSDLETTSFFYGNKNSIKLIESYKARGIGAVYNAVTKWILNLGTGGEGKTMGLAPYGEKFATQLQIDGELNGIKNDFSKFMKRMPLSDILDQIDPKNKNYPFRKNFVQCKDKKEILNSYYSRIAFDLQKETERVVTHLGKELFKKVKSKNICISGGVGLNSVANKIMFDSTNFEKFFAFPACSDAGIPFGLALWGYYNHDEFNKYPKKKLEFKNAYVGKSYSDEYVVDMLQKYNIPYKITSPKEIAKMISNEKVVGWFQGGSEYGPRALGHRSILADSRKAEMRDILNEKIKHRELFRPFAPSVLLEHCTEFFDIEGESPYMLLVAKVKKPELIPAITHVDGTARVQTVTKDANGIFYDVIEEFYKLTGIPLILNTSFNDAGEPIVETPEDATICFLKTKMDNLVLNNFVLDASNLDKTQIAEIMIKDREKKIEQSKERSLESYFKDFNKDECQKFIDESNKKSEWHAKYRSIYELEKEVLKWRDGKQKLIIIGTNDHTEILKNHINEFWNLNIVGFIDFKKDEQNMKPKYTILELEDLNSIDYDEIIISSYEYMYEIQEFLKKKGINKPIYSIYDNASRSFLEVFKKSIPFYNE